MNARQKKKTDWHKRYNSAREPHVVTLTSDFAGVKAGSTMLISSPGQIAAYLAAIPRGERRTLARMRSDLAKRSQADAMCPVTTSIFLKVVAEVALREMNDGKLIDDVAPFWRVITPESIIAAKLSCGPEGVGHLTMLDAAAECQQPALGPTQNSL
jgi:hypothetical protein